MPNAICGLPVVPPGSPLLERKPIPGCPNRSLTMHKDVLPLFLALAADYHRLIAPLDQGEWDEWSYDYRPARTSSSWSNHTGYAVDLNASAEGQRGTGWTTWWQTAKRNLKAQRLRRRYKVVNWGAWTKIADDPHTSAIEGWDAAWADAMHWELRAGTTLADVQAVIAKLGIQPNGTRIKPTRATKAAA